MLHVAASRSGDAAGPTHNALALTFLAATLAPYAVGIVLTFRVPSHGAGWAFCGLSAALSWSALADEYAAAALGGSGLPGAALVATFSDTSFVGWFVFLVLCLHYTADTVAPRMLRRLPAVTLVSALVYQVAALLRSSPLAPPRDDLRSPWSVPAVSAPAVAVSAVLVVVVGLCLVAAAAELVAAFRRSRGETRQQLLWLVAGAMPLVPAVVSAFAASYAGVEWVAAAVLAVCVVSLSVGAALSVLRYRLYDVERVVTDGAAYALSTGAVVASFGVVVIVMTRAVPSSPTSPVATVLATLAAVGVARPAYVMARDAVDRRFNRRRFDAVRQVSDELGAGGDVEHALRTALGDPHATLAFAAGDGWVTAAGHDAGASAHAVDLEHQGAVTAQIRFDPTATNSLVVAAVAAAARADIDNLGLRAELARQVEQVSESRTRLATAHLEERRRMERDLHDGAQQRLLGIALQLRSAQVYGDASVLREGIDRAVRELGETVQELRDLASGLQPAALAGGGLRAATEDLAGRLPLRLHIDVVAERFAPAIESAAWFVVAEGVSNAVKHAGTDEVRITAERMEGTLVVVVQDDGAGGAQPHGSGLQGLADRLAAHGGRLTLSSSPMSGTRLEAVLPCGS